LALDGGGWSALRPGLRYPLDRRLGGLRAGLVTEAGGNVHDTVKRGWPSVYPSSIDISPAEVAWNLTGTATTYPSVRVHLSRSSDVE
jgi:hypothetical protein